MEPGRKKILIQLDACSLGACLSTRVLEAEAVGCIGRFLVDITVNETAYNFQVEKRLYQYVISGSVIVDVIFNDGRHVQKIRQLITMDLDTDI